MNKPVSRSVINSVLQMSLLNPSRHSYYVSCFRINDTAIMS